MNEKWNEAGGPVNLDWGVIIDAETGERIAKLDFKELALTGTAAFKIEMQSDGTVLISEINLF